MAKWTGSNIGPRQLKSVNQALSAFNREAQSHTELTGVVGQPEEPYNRTVLWSPFGTARADAAPMLDAIHAQFGGVVTGDTYKSVVAALEAATAKLAETRPVEDNRRTPEADAATKAMLEVRNAEMIAKTTEAQSQWSAIWAKKPAGATALILAINEEDESDMMSDYHGSKTTRRVAIGWRTGSREDFRQLRAAAAGFEPTAHLGPGCDVWTAWVKGPEGETHGMGCSHVTDANYDAITATTEVGLIAAVEARIAEIRAYWEEFHASSVPEYNLMTYGYTAGHESVEHRDNYSMGHGNWLGRSQYSGWQVVSREHGSNYNAVEDALPVAGASAAPKSDPLRSPIR
jgi:hypothetical protein